MATASVSYTSECCICFETFNTPKILPCGHTFCLECLNRLISDKTETFSCPTCKQDVKIPNGGANDFTTNFQLTSKHTTQVRDQPPSTTQPKCPNHKQREVDYYCNNCNVGMCFKCILGQHKEHETLDIECDETRNKAIGKLQRSQDIIQNRIKHLEKNRSTLLESFEQLKSFCEDACAKVTEQTEEIVSDLRKSCKQVIKDIRHNLEVNWSKVEDREIEITSEINLLESNMELNISPTTKTTLNILLTLPRLKEIEKLAENRKDYNLYLQYLQWVGKDFSLDINQLGSVVFKPFYIPGWYQFIFNFSDIEKNNTRYYSKNKFRYNNLVWSCRVQRLDDDYLYIVIELLPYDNHTLDYCIFDCQLSLLNIDDDSKTVTKTDSDQRLERVGWLSVLKPITWSKLTDKNNGYVDANGQFVILFDLKRIKEIKFNQ